MTGEANGATQRVNITKRFIFLMHQDKEKWSESQEKEQKKSEELKQKTDFEKGQDGLMHMGVS